MSLTIGTVAILVTGLLALAYLALLLLHELGRVDLRRAAALHVVEEPGLARRGRVARLAALCVVVGASALLAPLGLIKDEPISYLVFLVLMCLLARSGRMRSALRERIARAPLPLAQAVVIALTVVLSLLALEVTGNERIYMLVTRPLSLAIEVLVIALVVLGLWLLLQRRGFALVAACALFYLVGVAEYFVASFKEMPILPSDLLALSTAAAVSSNYVYVISGGVLLGLACVVCVWWLTSCVSWGNGGRLWLIPLNVVLSAACAAAMAAGFLNVDFVDDLGITVKAWQPLEDYQANGFLTSFLTNAQGIMTSEPDDYTAAAAEQLVASYATEYDQTTGSSARRAEAASQFDERHPNVIVVMNETFSDLSDFDGLGVGYEGPQNFKSADALMRGTLYVSAYGGGTCNSEFELLTGLSMNYFGQGVYPYTMYNMEGVENLASHFSGLGYDTTAIHPNLATNWSRDIVYDAMGFDEFLTLDDFDGAERLRTFVTDAACYDTALDVIDSSDDPQFVFLVTMQNHSGYKTGDLDPETMTDYEPEYLSQSRTDELNEYLTLIQESDDALGELLAELEESDEPTVVLFFGDHQPYLTGRVNNALFEGEDDLTHTMRLWQTDYLIWANYDVAGADQLDSGQDLSTNYLGAVLCDAIGAPLTNYMKTNMTMHEYLQAINVIGYEGADGQFYWGEEGDTYASRYHDLERIQYRFFFDFDRPGGLWIVSREPGVTDPEGELG